MRQLAAESCLNESHQRCVYLIHQRIEAEVKSLSILLSARVFLSLFFSIVCNYSKAGEQHGATTTKTTAKFI